MNVEKIDKIHWDKDRVKDRVWCSKSLIDHEHFNRLVLQLTFVLVLVVECISKSTVVNVLVDFRSSRLLLLYLHYHLYSFSLDV